MVCFYYHPLYIYSIQFNGLIVFNTATGEPRKVLNELIESKRCEGSKDAMQALSEMDTMFTYLEAMGAEKKVFALYFNVIVYFFRFLLISPLPVVLIITLGLFSKLFSSVPVWEASPAEEDMTTWSMYCLSLISFSSTLL
jgi:hypothetical protein